MSLVNHRRWNENLNRDEKDQEGSYQMNPIALYCLNIDLDWSQFLKYREMPTFDQISLINDPMNLPKNSNGRNEKVNMNKKCLKKSHIINSIS